MNSKQTITRLAAAAALLSVSLGANAQRPIYDYARVTSSQPIVRYVTVQTPVRECRQDTEYYTSHHRRHATRGSTLIGALIGGAVGHQFGSGHGKDVATATGAVIGAAIGHDSAHRRYGTVRNARPVQRCETRYRSHQERRIDGYNVVYRYHGQKYATRMPYDPGHKIKIRVDIRPAG